MVVIIAFSNRETPGTHNWRVSMQKYGHEAVGMGTVWKGFMTKIQGYYDYIDALPTHSLSVIIDAFDVFACRSPQDLVETYSNFGKPLVVSTGIGCIPYMSCLPVKKWWQQTQQKPNKYKHVNSGFMMGTREALLHTLRYLLDSGIPDDQLALCHYVEDFPESVALDTESRLIATVPNGLSKDFREEEGQPVRITSGAKPYFLHTPGMCWDLGRRYNQWGSRLLGKQFQPYTAFQDAFPEMWRQSWFKFFLGLMFWIILILLLVAPKVAFILLVLVFIYFAVVKLT
jgi:hypothetical protein